MSKPARKPLGLDRPGDVMPTLEEVMRRRRARAAGLPLSASIEEIERAERGVPNPREKRDQGNALFGWEPHTRNRSGPETPATRPDVPRPLFTWEPPEPDQHGERYFRIELPWAVVVPDNAKHGVVEGRILLSKRYRRAKEKVYEIALASCKGRRFAQGCVEMHLTVYPPDNRKRDISNVQKLIGDALEEAAYTNDQQIVRWVVDRKVIQPDNPRIVVMVSAHPCP